ncbi:hypothetical protein FRC01_004334 [Tulasnella sp. 417]|nr:hypothetical protein FRC01_004334 [Tulasnella sp. 417]
MTSPAASISKQFIVGAGAKPPVAKYEASAPMSLENHPLVPPTTYHYLRLDWWGGARIVAAPSESPPGLYQETSEPTCNPFASVCTKLAGLGSSTARWSWSYSELADSLESPSASPVRLIRSTGSTTFALLEGLDDSADFGDTKEIIDIQSEGKFTWTNITFLVDSDPRVRSSAWFSTTSTFTKPDDPSRRALLWKANGLNPWWSGQRTLDDFDNVRYSCITANCSRDITLTRIFDNTIVAKFTLPRKFSWGLLGMLQVLEPVPEGLLDLIFCAMYIKYLRDEVSRSFPI